MCVSAQNMSFQWNNDFLLNFKILSYNVNKPHEPTLKPYDIVFTIFAYVISS